MSVKSNPGFLWFCFTFLCDWSRKIVPLNQPIRCKTNTNLDLVASVFPRFAWLACSHSVFSLALRAFSFLMIGSWNYCFFFYDIQSKSALLDNNSYDTNNDNDITFLLGNSSRNGLFPKCISTRKFKWDFYANDFTSSICSVQFCSCF